jgi:proline iminopeptidase
LIVKGACDYLSWSSAVDYARTLPNARLVYLHGGHNAYQDLPGDYLAVVRAFLADRPLPAALLVDPTGGQPPPDFEGPP